MAKILFALMIPITFFVTSTSFADPIELTAEELNVRDMILQELRPQVHELPSSTLVFNYSSFKKAKVDRNEQVQATRRLIEYFLDPNQDWINDPKSVLANGFYAATDPFVSQSFGVKGGKFQLVTVDLPKGMSYLELDYEWINPEIPQRLQKMADDEGSFASTLQFHSMLSAECKAFRRIALSTLQALPQVKAVFYPWYAAQFEGIARREKAFIFVDPQLVQENNIEIFTQVIETDPIKLQKQKQIEALLRMKGVDSLNQPYKSLWPKLDVSSAANVRGWICENIMDGRSSQAAQAVGH